MASWSWSVFCGRTDNLTVWTAGDFGHCFEQVFFVSICHIFLTIVSVYFIGKTRRRPVVSVSLPWFTIARVAVTLALASLPVFSLVLMALLEKLTISIVDAVSGSLVTFTWLLHAIFILCLKNLYQLSYRGDKSTLICYALTVISIGIQTRTVILLRIHDVSYRSVVEEYVVYVMLFMHLLYILTLLPSQNRAAHLQLESLNSMSTEYDPLLRHSIQGYGSLDAIEELPHVAETGASLWSKLTFHWVHKFMVSGYKGNIQRNEDLMLLPDRMNTVKIERIFANKFKKVDCTSNRRSNSSINQDDDVSFQEPAKKLKQNQRTLLRSLHQAFGTEYYLLGILKLIADGLGFAGPILLNLLVTYMENKSESVYDGYIYAACLFASTLLSALCSTQFNYNIQIVGFKFRAAIITTVYNKTVAVNTVSLSKFSSGEIVNFMSSDTDRIVNFCPSFHAFWSLPFQIAVSLFLLYQQVGLAFLAGLGFAVILIPINRWIAIKIGKLSNEMMKHKDSRVRVMHEILGGMRVVKFYTWEDHFTERINSIRHSELESLKGRKYLDALCVYFWATTPVLISILTFATYVLLGNKLTAAKIFTSLALFLMLISPLNAFPWVINGLMEAWVSLKRVQAYLQLSDIQWDDYYDTNTEVDPTKAVVITDGDFTWQEKQTHSSEAATDKDAPKTTTQNLTGINIIVNKGDLIGVIGRVGSGKSSLLNAIQGEMCRLSGSVVVSALSDGFGLATQEPWIKHATVRDNIVFQKEYNSRLYGEVLQACALVEDLKILPAGDRTEVGENGVTLSGGQKARVALARAVYQAGYWRNPNTFIKFYLRDFSQGADGLSSISWVSAQHSINKDKAVYLLDDPLSAVDAHVAEHLYQRCIMGLLANKTRILCTHHTKYLKEADLVIVMEDGKIVKTGSPTDILDSVDIKPAMKSVDVESVFAGDDACEDAAGGSLVQEEEKEKGVVRLKVYKAYWGAVGTCLAPTVLLALFLMQASRNTSDWWLSYWVSHANSSSGNSSMFSRPVSYSDTLTRFSHFSIWTGASNTTYSDDLSFYLIVYGSLAVANSIFTLFRAFLFAYGGVKAAKIIHKHLLAAILKAPVFFFDVTPIGRILNRFSSDLYSIDDSLPFNLNILLAQFFGILGTLVITCYGLPWFTVLLVPLAAIYYVIQQYYRPTSREIKRLTSISLSPIYAHFSETITGLTTIRALRETDSFCSENLRRLDLNQRARFAAQAASAWLGFRLQMLGVVMVTGVALIAVLEHHFQTVDPGLVGLALSYALSITNLLSGVVTSFTETEKQMVSIERAQQYIDTIPEESQTGILVPPPYWPIQGAVTFQLVQLQYRPGLPLALKGVTFETEPAEKIGIVGRTGSGKSSLFLALFRMVEVSGGNIYIDGINIHHLPLQHLRSHLAIIPQDPFLFSGTVRDNLDPIGSYSDGELWFVLQRCHLKTAVEKLGGLLADVAERGKHFSVGQRQLVCLARAMLTRAKVLCIDEATASVDYETDDLIQATIQQEFASNTVLTIAHRINTIRDSQRVLVMSNGEVAEFKPPDVLLSDPKSLFYKLWYDHS